VTARRGQQPMNAIRPWSLGLHTWLFLAYAYGLTFLIGYLVAAPTQRNGMILLCQCLLYASGATWVISDARRRGRPFTTAVGFWLCVTALVSTPIYTLWSRGWKGLAYIGLFLVGWYLVAFAGLNLGNYVMSQQPWDIDLGPFVE
jgi:hypothetical protein